MARHLLARDRTTRPETSDRAELTADQIRERYDKGTKALAADVRQYWINSSFLAGEQWLRWNESRNYVERDLPDDGRERITINRLLPTSRIIISKLLRRPLVFQVNPASSDDAAVEGARTSEAAITDVHREHEWENLRRELSWAVWKGGTGILCTEWEPAKARQLGTTDDGRAYGDGDTCEYALSIAEVAWEPGSKDPERGRWWIRASALPPNEVKDRYDLEAAPKADASAALSPLQQRLTRGDGQKSGGDLALVLTYYERPSDDSPGQVAVVVGNEVVERAEWPFPFTDRLNMVVAREVTVEGRGTGDTVLSAAISPQVAYNMAHTAIVEHMKSAGTARLVVPVGTDEDQFTDDPGVIVRENAGPQGRGIRYESPPAMPQWWTSQPERLERVIDDILGVHEISRGGAPAGVDSGVALSLLAEQDDTPVGAMAREIGEAFGRLATLVLRTLEEKVTDTHRKARVHREGATPEEVEWTGSDFAGQTTAVVPLEAVAPRSQAAQMQLGFLMWDKKLLTDPKQFARFTEIPGARDVEAELDLHAAKAQRENREFVTCPESQFPVPANFDRHATHVTEHNRFRLSSRYEQLPKDRQDLIDQHIQGHETLAAEEMGGQLARAKVSPALAAAAQANEPPLAGEPVPDVPQAPMPAVPPATAGGGAGLSPAPTEVPGSAAADPGIGL